MVGSWWRVACSGRAWVGTLVAARVVSAGVFAARLLLRWARASGSVYEGAGATSVGDAGVIRVVATGCWVVVATGEGLCRAELSCARAGGVVVVVQLSAMLRPGLAASLALASADGWR